MFFCCHIISFRFQTPLQIRLLQNGFDQSKIKVILQKKHLKTNSTEKIILLNSLNLIHVISLVVKIFVPICFQTSTLYLNLLLSPLENAGYCMAVRGYEFYLRVLMVSLTSQRPCYISRNIFSLLHDLYGCRGNIQF